MGRLLAKPPKSGAVLRPADRAWHFAFWPLEERMEHDVKQRPRMSLRLDLAEFEAVRRAAAAVHQRPHWFARQAVVNVARELLERAGEKHNS